MLRQVAPIDEAAVGNEGRHYPPLHRVGDKERLSDVRTGGSA